MHRLPLAIEVFVTEGCSSLEPLRASIEQATGGGEEVAVSYHVLEEGDPRADVMKGSPTVLVGGVDISPGGKPGTG